MEKKYISNGTMQRNVKETSRGSFGAAEQKSLFLSVPHKASKSKFWKIVGSWKVCGRKARVTGNQA
jgi:hypothetical protein